MRLIFNVTPIDPYSVIRVFPSKSKPTPVNAALNYSAIQVLVILAFSSCSQHTEFRLKSEKAIPVSSMKSGSIFHFFIAVHTKYEFLIRVLISGLDNQESGSIVACPVISESINSKPIEFWTIEKCQRYTSESINWEVKHRKRARVEKFAFNRRRNMRSNGRVVQCLIIAEFTMKNSAGLKILDYCSIDPREACAQLE